MAVLIAVTLGHCRSPDLVPQIYYLVLAELTPPAVTQISQPTNLRIRYQALLREMILEWEAPTDVPFPTFYIYYFLDSQPACCPANNRLDSTTASTYSQPSDPFTGTIYFEVTAFNGFTESRGSGAVGINLATDPPEFLPH